MKIKKIEQLLENYLEGETTLDEERQLRAFFREGNIPEHLQPIAELFRYGDRESGARTEADPLAKIQKAQPERAAAGKESRTENDPQVRYLRWTLRIAAGTILVLIGLSAGLLLNGTGASDEELVALQTEIRQMKSALMYGSYQQATASERISAVNMTARLQTSRQLDEEITEILIYTMNNDQNVNVRLAAAEALFKFRDEPGIGKALASSLPRQSDPVMQITLIDMLVRMKEKSSITEMQKMLINNETQEIVKERLQESIAELKT